MKDVVEYQKEKALMRAALEDEKSNVQRLKEETDTVKREFAEQSQHTIRKQLQELEKNKQDFEIQQQRSEIGQDQLRSENKALQNEVRLLRRNMAEKSMHGDAEQFSSRSLIDMSSTSSAVFFSSSVTTPTWMKAGLAGLQSMPTLSAAMPWSTPTNSMMAGSTIKPMLHEPPSMNESHAFPSSYVHDQDPLYLASHGIHQEAQAPDATFEAIQSKLFEEVRYCIKNG